MPDLTSLEEFLGLLYCPKRSELGYLGNAGVGAHGYLVVSGGGNISTEVEAA